MCECMAECECRVCELGMSECECVRDYSKQLCLLFKTALKLFFFFKFEILGAVHSKAKSEGINNIATTKVLQF